MPFTIAHVSDLHLSEFGDTFHDRLRIVSRSARIASTDEARFETAWSEAGWRVLRERGKRRSKVALIDPDGYAHGVPSLKESGGLHDPVERAAAKACRLEARRATTLARHLPSNGAARQMWEATPRNSNVRLLRAAPVIGEVDAVLVTGDITDDGFGYELVEAVFDRYRKAGRLWAVPGNHDLFLFPLRGSGRPRHTHESKRNAWRAFATRIGLELDPSGGWFRHEPDASLFVIGLDSCVRQRRFYRHNGYVGPEQIAFIRCVAERPEFKASTHRLVALHHHVVPLPHGVGRRAPPEIGMRLDDAREVAELLDRIGVTAVLHGHRHVSEQRQPAGSNFTILASPSFTLGCRSGDAPSFWRVELDAKMHASRVRVPVDAVEVDEESPEDAAEAPADDGVDGAPEDDVADDEGLSAL